MAVSVNQGLTTRSRPPGSRRPRPGLPVGWPARGPLPASSPGPGREDGSQAVAGPPGPLRVPGLAGQLEPRLEKPLAAPPAWTNTAASQDSGATALGPRLRARQPARSPTGLVGPEARPLAPAGDEASGGLGKSPLSQAATGGAAASRLPGGPRALPGGRRLLRAPPPLAARAAGPVLTRGLVLRRLRRTTAQAVRIRSPPHEAHLLRHTRFSFNYLSQHRRGPDQSATACWAAVSARVTGGLGRAAWSGCPPRR